VLCRVPGSQPGLTFCDPRDINHLLTKLLLSSNMKRICPQVK
jgi:hypothetical protein